MPSYIIGCEEGLHLRHAALLVTTARPFCSDIVIEHDDKAADAKSILAIMMLGVQAGEVLTVTARGPDAHGALRAIEELICSVFKGERVEMAGSGPLPPSREAMVFSAG